MAVYTYPACFLEEPDGRYSVIFQRSLGGTTCGNTIEEAMEKAMECMSLVIESYLNDGEQLPKPEEMNVDKIIKDLKLENQGFKGFINYVSIDYDSYAKENLEKSVKKTLTIPRSMDIRAKKLGLNFSKILQEGLAKAIKKKEKEIKKAM